MTTVLVVDDDHKIVTLVAAYLQREGWQVEEAYDGLEAIQLLRGPAYDAVVVDVMLPRLDGIRIAEEARRGSSTPILMLTALGTVRDKVRGLDAGADDYLLKPFAATELVARLRSLLRRSRPVDQRGTVRLIDLTLDLDRRKTDRDGRECGLTRLEFNLLAALVLARGRVLTRGSLIDALADDQEEPILERSIDAYVGRLRRKLGDTTTPARYVETVRGVGYRAVLDA